MAIFSANEIRTFLARVTHPSTDTSHPPLKLLAQIPILQLGKAQV